MYTTWILVANRTGARVFENKGPGKDLTMIESVTHPQGDLRDIEINSDRPGRSFSSVGTYRHTYEKSESPQEHEASAFARSLANLLDEGRRNRKYEKLVLVAEPRFLGALRSALPKSTAEMVHADVKKDLATVSNRDILDHLGDLNGLWDDVHRTELFVPSTRVGER